MKIVGMNVQQEYTFLLISNKQLIIKL